MKIRFLTEREFDNSGVLKLLETVPHPTDFAKITGVTDYVNTNQSNYYYWSSICKENEFSDDLVYILGQKKSIISESENHIGIRPVISFQDFQKLNIMHYGKIETTKTGEQIKKIIFGAFPQNKITMDKIDSVETNENFTFETYLDMKEHTVIASKNNPTQKYIQYNKTQDQTVYGYDGGYHKNNKDDSFIQQFQIQPIEWIIDEKNELLITDKILMGSSSYSDASYYLNRHFQNEILQNTNIWQNEFLLKKRGYTNLFNLSYENTSTIQKPIIIHLFQEKLYNNLKTEIDKMGRIEFLQAISKLVAHEPKHNQQEYNLVVNYARCLIKDTMAQEQKTPKEVWAKIGEEIKKNSLGNKKHLLSFPWLKHSDNSR